MTYIGRIQRTVTQWVDLRTIFKMCARLNGYEEGERRKEAWWRQEVVETYLREALEEILREARRGRQGEKNIN